MPLLSPEGEHGLTGVELVCGLDDVGADELCHTAALCLRVALEGATFGGRDSNSQLGFFCHAPCVYVFLYDVKAGYLRAGVARLARSHLGRHVRTLARSNPFPLEG